MKYRVKEAFIAVRQTADGKSQFVTMEVGNIFTIRGEERAGLVKVLYRGQIVAVFLKDIEHRAVKIRETWT
jgi:hypothetical protein